MVDDKRLGVTMTEIVKADRAADGGNGDARAHPRPARRRSRPPRASRWRAARGSPMPTTSRRRWRGCAPTRARPRAVRREARHRRLVGGAGGRAHRVPVVACGVGADADAAVRAIRAGAREYLPLPPDAELIAAVLAAAGGESHALIARDPAMEAAVRRAEQVAGADASVLITGESGTGKEVLARHIHRRSRRAGGAVRLGELRRDPGEPARKRAVRPREGRLHRRGRAPHRQVRGGRRRHAAARRDQRDGPAPAGQAAARAAGARDRPRRRQRAGQGQHPPPRHHQPRPRRRGRARQIPRGPVFPPQRGRRCASRRCASGPATSSCWPSISRANTPR